MIDFDALRREIAFYQKKVDELDKEIFTLTNTLRYDRRIRNSYVRKITKNQNTIKRYE